MGKAARALLTSLKAAGMATTRDDADETVKDVTDIEGVVVAMRGHAGSEEVERGGCVALRNVVTGNAINQIHTRAGNAGTVEALAAIMCRRAENDELLLTSTRSRNAIETLTLLTMDHPVNQTRAGNAGAVSPRGEQ